MYPYFRARTYAASFYTNTNQVDPYTLPSRRNAAVMMTTDDGGEPRLIKSVAVDSVVELVDDNGEVVGETSGVQIKLYGLNVA